MKEKRNRMTVSQFAALGGRARAEKLGRARVLEIARKASDAAKAKRLASMESATAGK